MASPLNVKTPSSRSAARSRVKSVFLWLASLGIIGFFYAVAGSSGYMRFLIPRLQDNRFALQAEGFFAGQLNLLATPSKELLALPNPYNIYERAASKVPYFWDCILYKGKYFLYWGPVPILLIYMPWRLIFGDYPSDTLINLIFALATVGLLTRLFYMLSGTHSERMALPIMLMFAFGSSLSLVLPHSYVVFISGGLFFTSLGWYLLVRALQGGSRLPLLVSAGLCFGLAFGCRPTNLFYAVGAALALVLAARQRPLREIFKDLMALMAPVALAGLLFGLYNFLRFGNPFDFGINYQLGMEEHANMPFSTIRYPYLYERILKHLWYDLWAPIGFSENFPFIMFGEHRSSPWPLPSTTRFALDSINGAFATSPLILLGLVLLPYCLYHRLISKIGAIFSSAAIAASLAVFIFLSTCWYSSQRYLLDFQPLWLLAAMIVITNVGLSLRQTFAKYILGLSVSVAFSFTLAVGLAGIFHGPYAAEINLEVLKWSLNQLVQGATSVFR